MVADHPVATSASGERSGGLLSIIVPVKDEEEAIAGFVTRTGAVLDGVRDRDGAAMPWEILFVDDGSTDGTLAAMRVACAGDARVRGLSLSRNFGKEAALSAGLDHVRGDAIIPIDVDLQDPPELIPEMVERWRRGSDVVYGVRRNRQTDAFAKRLTADLYYRVHNWVSADRIPEHAGDFRLLDRRVVDVIRAMPERNRFMKGLFAWAGFRQDAVYYDRRERQVGHTKFNYWKLWTFALDGITSTSTLPLRVWSYLGGVIAAVALLYAAYLVGRTLLYGTEVAGYPSLMVAVLFIGGMQLLSLGIQGEYVGRILVETKHRPIYIVREHLGE